MNLRREKLDRLYALARRAPAPLPSSSETVPHGFAERIVSRLASEDPSLSRVDLWERFCWWGAGISLAACLLTLALRPGASDLQAFDLLLQIPQEPISLFGI